MRNKKFKFLIACSFWDLVYNQCEVLLVNVTDSNNYALNVHIPVFIFQLLCCENVFKVLAKS